MKVWLNDLKEGDIFYHIIFNNIYKCRHLGDAHNKNFKMNRIKFEIIDDKDNLLNILDKLYGKEHEAFVNQYVYDNYESALEDLKINLKNELNKIIDSINIHKKNVETLEIYKRNLENKILKYEN